MRDKQIEMHELAKQMSEAISTAVEQRYIEDEAKLEAVLRANGWRKASDVAREIFEEIEEALDGELCKEDERERIAWMESDMREHAIHHYAGDKLETLMTAFDLLKKMHLGEDINAPTKESEGEG